MDWLFSVLSMLGGLCLFLFGMSVMGDGLERRAGSGLRSILSKLTENKIAGFLTGLGVTSVIQSSSATTVMVVGFVNSGMMTLKQAINVIIGANVGTTVTSWLVAMTSIEGGVGGLEFLNLLKPTAWTPILAMIGIVFYMFCKSNKKKDTGSILLGFATLMAGMELMTGAVGFLEDQDWFRNLFLAFNHNPLLGLLAGAVLTAIIQSSSASVGIIQALTVTGAITNGAAIPMVMGTGIGTCVTAMLSAIGAKPEARRAAVAHLMFNIIGSIILLPFFWIVKDNLQIAFLDEKATMVSVAVINTAFKIAITIILLPFAAYLEKLAIRMVPSSKDEEKKVELDTRLLATPPVALQQCGNVVREMAEVSIRAFKNSLCSLKDPSPELAESIRADEKLSDHYEDVLGTFLIQLSAERMSQADSEEATKFLKVIGDFERISDHAVNILESAEEMREKKLAMTEQASREFATFSAAVEEILDNALNAFVNNDLSLAMDVEPLEQVIDKMRDKLRNRHIKRMQQGECSIGMGFIWSDLLSNLERTSDHCSNIAGCVIDTAHHNLNLHEELQAMRSGSTQFAEKFEAYIEKYSLK
ncbi:MAG: Na/Pi cotransporter family protein [Clostridia bacterium]|nr:Na/Pi cotransporter family protein [Clostridia bacterium]